MSRAHKDYSIDNINKRGSIDSLIKRKHKHQFNDILNPFSKLTPTNQSYVSISSQQKLNLTQHQLNNKIHPFHQLNNKINPFQALTQFKSTEDQYESLRKRLQVLKIKDQKNNNRYHLNHRRLILHDTIQKVTSMQKSKMQQWRSQNEQRKHQQKIQNLKQKLIHHRNIQSVIETMKQTKAKEYSLRKQESINNQQKIIKKQQESFTENKAKVQKIKEILNFSRASLQAYNRNKITKFKQKKYEETDHLITRKQRKEQEIKRMMELEMEMIQKQSSSRISLNKSIQKMNQILNPETNIKSSRINKMFELPEKLHQQNLVSNEENKKQFFSVSTTPLNSENEKYSINLTRESSFKSQKNKNQLSLPQINSSRKYP